MIFLKIPNLMAQMMDKLFSFMFILLITFLNLSVDCSKLVALTFGASHGDLAQRQKHSASTYNIDLHFLEPESNIVTLDRLEMLKHFIESMKRKEEAIILLVESGSLFMNTSDEIIARFEHIGSRLVVSATDRCHPDVSLKDSYPKVPDEEKPYAQSTGLIGYISTILEALSEQKLQHINDMQFYISKLVIDDQLRMRLGITIDSRSIIFSNIDGSFDELQLRYSPAGTGYLINNITGSLPAIVQPNGHKEHLSTLSNYLGQSWSPTEGCRHCSRKSISSSPNVTIVIFIDQPTPFISEFFKRAVNLFYPKSQIILTISNMVPSHEPLIQAFIDQWSPLYKSFNYLNSSSHKTMIDRRLEAMKNCSEPNCDYLLFIDSVVQLTNEKMIEDLISYDKPIIAPLVSRREQLWSNFWGAIGSDGYYSRSFDYLDIVNGVKKGLWNVPHIHSIYLMKRELLLSITDVYMPLPEYKLTEMDMIFSGNLRRKDIFMYVVNEHQYGYLVDAENTKTEHLHNDLWEVFNNPLDWKEKYIHENYTAMASDDVRMEDIPQPCPDVFWWPFVSETFAKHMIEEMEHFGQWSAGTNHDSRLEGGYENVPTRDIHMRQVDWEEHWLHILRTYVYPIQTKVFQGYYDMPTARMNFVVRYKPHEQDRLRPHQDSSSYSLNIALNEAGIEYKGGGTKFHRYNCSVTQNKIGFVLMHPGRITHIHEGLPTTWGTRYIFITFVNP